MQFVTRAGDEKFLIAGAAVALVAAELRGTKEREFRHLFAALVITSAFDHLSKGIFDQERLNRTRGRFLRAAIPKSGRKCDSFPSGHAMHLGTLASALSRAYPRKGPAIWLATELMAYTRVQLLAHWLSDVVAGFAVGILIERLLYLFERNGQRADE